MKQEFESQRAERQHVGRTDREVREALRIPQIKAAALAGVAEATLRAFELDPSSVRVEKRLALDRVYSDFRAEAARAGVCNCGRPHLSAARR
jgi:hypothetical protein